MKARKHKVYKSRRQRLEEHSRVWSIIGKGLIVALILWIIATYPDWYIYIRSYFR